MNEALNPFVDNAIQCWGCGIFDNLFRVVSAAGATVYTKITDICFILFTALFVFYVIWAVWRQLNPKKPETSDKYYTKSIVRVVINSLIVLTLLGIGVGFPRFITRVTFEPVADVALVYSQAMLKTSNEIVEQHVSYKPKSMPDNGFYRPELRDKIIALMATTVNLFQNYIKLGIAIIDYSFTWENIFNVSDIFRQIILFVIGVYLCYEFFKLFIRFCFYFVDVILAMAMFAFLFPIGLMMMAFRGGDIPEWMSSLGKGLGTNQLKKLINAIVTLASAVVTYVIIMVIISRFFTDSGTSVDELMRAITTGEVLASDLSNSNLATLTLGSTTILVCVLTYIYSQIPNVSKMILETFGVAEEKVLSEDMANSAEKLTSYIFNGIKSVGSMILNGGEKKEDNKDTKKDDKKSTDKNDKK